MPIPVLDNLSEVPIERVADLIEQGVKELGEVPGTRRDVVEAELNKRAEAAKAAAEAEAKAERKKAEAAKKRKEAKAKAKAEAKAKAKAEKEALDEDRRNGGDSADASKK